MCQCRLNDTANEPRVSRSLCRDELAGQFLVAGLAREDEQPVAPRRRKYGREHPCGIPFGSDAQHAAETSRCVVGLRAVVIDEYLAVASIAKQGAAERANVLRRVDPTGCLRIELVEPLQLAVSSSTPIAAAISTALPAGLFSLRETSASRS
jgi:hypothetical protein